MSLDSERRGRIRRAEERKKRRDSEPDHVLTHDDCDDILDNAVMYLRNKSLKQRNPLATWVWTDEYDREADELLVDIVMEFVAQHVKEEDARRDAIK
jgi:hypothetical protein